MPPLPTVANVFRARVLFTITNKPTQGLRMFFRWSGTTPTVTAANALAEDLYNALVDAGIAAAFPNFNRLTGVELVDLTSALGAEGFYAHGTTGTETGEPLPAEATFVTSFEIPRRYRGGHPKAHWPFGVAADLTTPDRWLATKVTAWQELVNAAIATFVGKSSGGCGITAQVAVSFYEGFTVITNPITHRARNVPNLRTPALVTNVTSVIGRDYVGSLRKRRIKTS
jgi:hypothetical protein